MPTSLRSTQKRNHNPPPTTTPAAAPAASPPAASIKRRRRVVTKGNNANASHNGVGEEEEDLEDILGFKEAEIIEIRASLLKWYDENRRDLPWRRGKEEIIEEEEVEVEKRAYGVWVSEVMLQQTGVATVVDYYRRWMTKWPSIHHLSLASLEGAKRITEGGGRFPRSVMELKKVPGIGNYTAGAIASIAFNKAVAVVDGNVLRVLARLKAISANPKDLLTVKKFWKLAEQIVDPDRPGDFNQALMELGATICTPTSPSCSSCRVSGQCHALATARDSSSLMVTDYPQKVVKTKQRNEFSAVCVLEITKSLDFSEKCNSKSLYIIVKRPDEGLLAGLWEFPSVLLKHDSDATARRKLLINF
ncbi:Adenine DNA glycosylase-like protein [Drosera capensis]